MLKIGFAVLIVCAGMLQLPQESPSPVRLPLPRIDVRADGIGSNLGPWVRDFIRQVGANWAIPAGARDLKGHVAATMIVRRDGTIGDVAVTAPPELAALKEAAETILGKFTAHEPLPPAYPGDRAPVIITFYYNEVPPQELVVRPGWPPPGVYKLGSDIVVPRVVRSAKPQYTSDAMRARISGNVTLACVVRADGTVGDVEVTRSLDPWLGLDDEAIKSARYWQFEPGTRGGQPVPVAVTIEMTFTLR